MGGGGGSSYGVGLGFSNGPNTPAAASVTISYEVTGVYAGTPGQTDCVGQTISVLSNEYNDDLSAAEQALGFDSVKAMKRDIQHYCSGS